VQSIVHKPASCLTQLLRQWQLSQIRCLCWESYARRETSFYWPVVVVRMLRRVQWQVNQRQVTAQSPCLCLPPPAPPPRLRLTHHPPQFLSLTKVSIRRKAPWKTLLKILLHMTVCFQPLVKTIRRGRMCDLGFPSVVNYRQILTIVIIVTPSWNLIIWLIEILHDYPPQCKRQSRVQKPNSTSFFHPGTPPFKLQLLLFKKTFFYYLKVAGIFCHDFVI